ncbi:hypothetical protein I4U23_019870 [Adineta vaga]|nr:hypothetical protein I4U23_019870 [Adineta vaga]
MGNTKSSARQERRSSEHVSTHLPVIKPEIQISDIPKIWNPAFNEFQFGDSPQGVNSNLPSKFASLTWETMPQATEFSQDTVKYIWLTLNNFGDEIIKFIPPDTTVTDASYICFLFVHEKLFNISIRFIYDKQHPNYNPIIEAYANAVNTPVIDTADGKDFYYEDNRIIYCSCFPSDKQHVVIEVIQKGQTEVNEQTYRHLSCRHEQKQQQQQKPSIKPILSSPKRQYDIMISYCHRDRELCHRLYYRLLENNFRVWIDLKNMYGPIVERMAEAIENSQFVLICMSNAYKSSSYCQLEAEYAFKFQACLIPVVIQKDFAETGWLGMLCGLRLKIDFAKRDFEEAYEDLCNEIQHYQKQSTNKNSS